MKKLFIFSLFTLLLAHSVFANSITLICFQNTNTDELCKTITQEFEDNLFEPFFDNGFIVTSIPPAEINSQNEISIDSIKTNFENEPTDLGLIAYLEYENELTFNTTLNRRIPNWKMLKISLIDFSKGKEIYKKNVDLKQVKSIDPKKKAQEISIAMAKEIITIINKGKGE